MIMSKGEPAFRRRTFTVARDIELIGDETGPENGDTILFLHGGGQTRGAWRTAQTALARHGLRSLGLDQRGHGESGRASNYLLGSYANDLAQVAHAIGGRPAFVGASLGGLSSLLLLGETKTPASALVLVDITHRFEPSGAEKIRAFMLAYPEGFESLDQAADAIVAYLPQRKRLKNLTGLEKNLARNPDGRWRWRWDLQFLSGPPGVAFAHDEPRLRAAASALRVPTLLIQGGASEIVSEQAVEEFCALAPTAKVARLEGASHMVAGDNNDVFLNTILDFLLPVLKTRVDL